MSDNTDNNSNKKRKADVLTGDCDRDKEDGRVDKDNTVVQLLSSLGQETKKLQNELKETQSMLKVAMKFIADRYRYVSVSWKAMPEELKESPLLVTEILKKHPNGTWMSWNDIPSCLQTNPDVVMQAVESFGILLNWKDIPVSTRTNPKVILTAIRCMKTKKYPLKLSRRDIPEDILQSNRELALGALELGLVSWRQVRPSQSEWKNDAKLSILALKHGKVDTANWRTCAPKLSEYVIRQALFDGAIEFWHVPEDLKESNEFCRSVIFHFRKDAEVLARPIFAYQHEVQSDSPKFAEDAAIWSELLDLFGNHPEKSHVVRDVFEYAPAFIRDDANLMAMACKIDPMTLEYFGTNIHGAIRDIIAENPKCLLYAPSHFIAGFPDFCRDQLGRCSRTMESSIVCEEIEYLAEKIPNAVMNDPAFATVWLQDAGLPLVRTVPNEWKTDRSKFRLVAEHCRNWHWKTLSFRACEDFTVFDDATFMMEVLRREPRLCGYASDNLFACNTDVTMLGLTSGDFFDDCMEEISSHHHGRAPRHRRFHRVWDDHPSYLSLSPEIFVDCISKASNSVAFHTFLCGVQASTSTETNPLGLLNHRELKEKIFDNLGIPRNAETVRNMRTVMSNMLRWMAEHPAENVQSET